mmetsp:Transcript_52773/g.150412  ORF Transcript_52773/g.150412 Transcript_52773/m.150412 type:complete len:292 (+) Transcript_52773:606-1481(+)
MSSGEIPVSTPVSSPSAPSTTSCEAGGPCSGNAPDCKSSTEPSGIPGSRGETGAGDVDSLRLSSSMDPQRASTSPRPPGGATARAAGAHEASRHAPAAPAFAAPVPPLHEPRTSLAGLSGNARAGARVWPAESSAGATGGSPLGAQGAAPGTALGGPRCPGTETCCPLCSRGTEMLRRCGIARCTANDANWTTLDAARKGCGASPRWLRASFWRGGTWGPATPMGGAPASGVSEGPRCPCASGGREVPRPCRTRDAWLSRAGRVDGRCTGTEGRSCAGSGGRAPLCRLCGV